MKIGITGGIGSGKSSVTDYLRSKGETVICADEVARQVVQPGEEGAKAVKLVFGEMFFDDDGILDRKKLAEYVFADSDKTKKLNELLHPIIIARINSLASIEAGRVFIDAALLIQSGMQTDVDYVWLVIADKETRIERVMKRDSTDRKSVLQRMSNQLSDSQMKRYASEIIENSGDIKALHDKVDNLLQKSIYKEDLK